MNYKRLLFLVPLSIMTVIFIFSSQNAGESLEVSDGLLFNTISVFSKLFNLYNVDLNAVTEALSTFIRKLAHFSVYAVLCISFVISLYYNFQFKVRKHIYCISQTLSMIYAVTDEIHQLFVPGRSGNCFDVLLDSCGAFFGILLICIFFKKKK